MDNNNCKVLCNTKFLQLKYTLKSNGSKWVYAHRPNASNVVVIVPVITKPDGEYILFLKTFRPPIAAESKAKGCIELPAGLVGDIDKDENILDAAKRELLEETGLKAELITIACKNIASSAGSSSETSVVFLAKITDVEQKIKPLDDDGTIIERVEVKKQDIYCWLKQCEDEGYSIGAQTLSGLYYYFIQNF